MTKIIQYLSIKLIKCYQKFISPYKGFSCAYHKYNGGRSCSHFALTAIRRHGTSALWLSFPKRLEHCKISAMILNEDEKKRRKQHSCTDSCAPEDCANCADILKVDNHCNGSCSDTSLSVFLPLQWLYKISLKQRSKKRGTR